jgi:hypothetical protein
MNQVYPAALNGFLTKKVDVLADTIVAYLLDASYAYDAAHTFLSSVPGGARKAGPVTLTAKAISGGVFTAASVVFTAPAPGATVTALLVTASTGTDATSRLLGYLDTNADSSPINFVTDGLDVEYDWTFQGVLYI